MLIDPKIKSLIIFNGGGGIIEREIKLTINQGTNKFEIQNVPASFDPNSANITLEYLNDNDKELITLQQTIVSLPDPKNVQQLIEREKGAANSIISYAIDFTRELREEVSIICEASSYKTYSDMKGTFNFILNSKKDGEIAVKVKYFISDLRIKWETTLQVNLNEDGKTVELEGYIVVDNQTGFNYENVDLGFAIFELPGAPNVDYNESYYNAEEAEVQQAVFKALPKQKRTQRMKNLML